MQITSTLDADAMMRPVEAGSVRVATPADEGDLVAMLRIMHTEGGLRDGANQPFPISEDKLRMTVQRAIIPQRNDPDAGQAVCGIIGAPGQLEASICLATTATWYSDMPFLADLWVFVCPDYRRKTGHARTLIGFAKAMATAAQLPLMMGNVSAERSEAKDRFLERGLGAKPYGRYFVWHPASQHTGAN